jgi:hypothetical protein
MNLNPKPFDPETFVEEGNDDDDDDQRVKLKVENTIRWRHGVRSLFHLVKLLGERKGIECAICKVVGRHSFAHARPGML